jgi:hypothetical protein
MHVDLQVMQNQAPRTDYFSTVHDSAGTIGNDLMELKDLKVSTDVQNYNTLLFTSVNSLYNAMESSYASQTDTSAVIRN